MFRLLLIGFTLFTLSACVVKPAGKKVQVYGKVVTPGVTKKQKQTRIVVITRMPRVGEKCWPHKQVWHCRVN